MNAFVIFMTELVGFSERWMVVRGQIRPSYITGANQNALASGGWRDALPGGPGFGFWVKTILRLLRAGGMCE